MFCWGQNIQSIVPPFETHRIILHEAWPTLPIYLSLFFCNQFKKNLYEKQKRKKNTRLASVFYVKSQFPPNKNFKSLSLSLCPYIWTYRNSSTVWWRLCTRLNPISSVVSSPTSSSSLVNDGPPSTCTIPSFTPSQSITLSYGTLWRGPKNNPPMNLLQRRNSPLRRRRCVLFSGPCNHASPTRTNRHFVFIFSPFCCCHNKRSNWITWCRRSAPRRLISSVVSSPTRPSRPVRLNFKNENKTKNVQRGQAVNRTEEEIYNIVPITFFLFLHHQPRFTFPV